MLGSGQLASQPLASGSGRTLTVNVLAAAFVLTGIAVVLTRLRELMCAYASFVLTGVAGDLTRFKVYVAYVYAGVFSLAGIAVLLPLGRTIVATVTTYTFTGVAAILTKFKVYVLYVAARAFLLTGGPNTFPESARTLYVGTGPYASAGVETILALVRFSASIVNGFVTKRLQVPILRDTRRQPPTLS